MDDNVWEYPFGELDDDDDMFFRKPEKREEIKNIQSVKAPLL
jgi:hypothetical protein